MVMFYPDVPDEAVEFEGETEDVVLVAAVSHHKAPVRLPRQNPLRCLPRKRSPVPAALRKNILNESEIDLSQLTSFTFSILAAKSMRLSAC